MTNYYPAFLDLQGKECIVVGGGTISEGKINQLLACGAEVTVVSPSVTSSIRDLTATNHIRWHQREYVSGDLQRAFLAIAATNSPEVNRRVSEEAVDNRILINVIDTPDICSFIAPSIVRRGEVIFAISTGGASPALARKLRECIENNEFLQYADLAPFLSRARQEVRSRGIAVPPDVWQRHINMTLVALVKDGLEQQALEHLIESLARDSNPK
ncbi:bifunctional precorrin-2 dehydrogenase/sirohydrochlorin ferrochelatase [SAR202 cluster bacterium AD-804-J14_MRT_500m]|nr:bifunctional precorrin-2 dehydrogenase/sirohydrochlorin ferrochelatase [SAR202 cluster bacterium AD-804-J14_MRT_500m]